MASKIPEILSRYEAELLADWLKELLSTTSRRELRMKESEVREQAVEFSRLFREAAQRGNLTDLEAPEWGPVREHLARISRSRGLQGFTPSETAIFILSFKRPLFTALRREVSQADQMADELWTASALIDKLGLFVIEIHQKTREEVISRQQQEMMELSTPVVNLWDNVLALPLIGTLDSSRTQTVMESLLQRIADVGSEIAIIDITGVPTVDTLTAQHLLKTVTATRLMGAEAIISGIRPQIAQTIVHLGVDLSGVTTKATLAGAFQLALQRIGLTVQRAPHPQHKK